VKSRLSQDLKYLDSDRVASLLRNATDFIFLIDTHDVVVDVSVTHGSDLSLKKLWTGRLMTSIVSSESLGKLTALMQTDVARSASEVVWRHINLVRSEAETVPLLMIFAQLPAQSNSLGLIIARDLRPTLELSERFRLATLEMESRFEELIGHNEISDHQRSQHYDTTFGVEAASQLGGSLINNTLKRISECPMDDIITETTRILERLCIGEALKRTRGSEAEAALMLGISIDVLRRKLLN
jgi:hypothetical protein